MEPGAAENQSAGRSINQKNPADGSLHPPEGWTGLVITPATMLSSMDGLLTGLHGPRSSHLAMLLALAGQAHISLAYEQALQLGDLWHEFGDLHLILP